MTIRAGASLDLSRTTGALKGPLTAPPEGDTNGGFFTHGIGWYRKSFTLPASAAGRKVVVEFDGVYMNSDVWINGHFLGRRPYGFVGFRYDLTDFLTEDGSPNILVVRVDDSLEPAAALVRGLGNLPARAPHRRRLHALQARRRHQDHDPAGHGRARRVQCRRGHRRPLLHGGRSGRRGSRTRGTRNPSKREVGSSAACIAPDGPVAAAPSPRLTLESMRPGQRATQWVTVAKPSLWSDRTPGLYRLRSTLALDGATLDETTTTFGIRQLVFDPDRACS